MVGNDSIVKMSLYSICQDSLLESFPLSYQILDVISVRTSIIKMMAHSLRTNNDVSVDRSKRGTYTRIMSCSMIGPSSSSVVA